MFIHSRKNTDYFVCPKNFSIFSSSNKPNHSQQFQQPCKLVTCPRLPQEEQRRSQQFKLATSLPSQTIATLRHGQTNRRHHTLRLCLARHPTFVLKWGMTIQVVVKKFSLTPASSRAFCWGNLPAIAEIILHKKRRRGHTQRNCFAFITLVGWLLFPSSCFFFMGVLFSP